MCFELDSLPPVPAISGAAVSHDDLVLEARDGNRFAAFLATPDEPSGIGVVVLPDVRGLYRFYEELALRFAERGYTALAIDYFGRTAGVEKRGDEFEYPAHVEQTSSRGDPGRRGRGGRASALARRSPSSSPSGSAWAGGSHGSQQQAATVWRERSASTAVPGERDGAPGPEQLASQMQAPVLALQAGADENITAEDNEAFERALTDAGVEHELVVYDGAPHSFFDRKHEEFAGDSEDAWNRVLAFLERHAR